MSDNNNHETSLDSAFKSIMSDSYILARMLEPLIEEFNGKDDEYIRSCLPIKEGNREIVKISNEYSSKHLGPAFLDNVFEINIPGKGRRTVIVGVEGQGDRNPGYRLYNRATYYTSCMIVDQKGRYFDNDNYDNICKVLSIWVILNPRKEDKNTIVRYHTIGEYQTGYEGRNLIIKPDLVEVIEINIGDADDLQETMMGMMNTLFSKGLTEDQRIERLSNSYKIRDVDSLTGKVEVLSMSLEEELIHTYKQDGIDEAIESGAVITREEYQRQMADYQKQIAEKDLENSVRIVRTLMRMGHSLEEGISVISEDQREAVRKIVNEEQDDEEPL